MSRRVLWLSIVVAAAIALAPRVALALTANDLVGTWLLIKADAFGANPKGLVMFDAGGRFIQIITRADLPKYAANARDGGTAEEFKATALGSIGFFGTYSVNGTDLIRHVEASSYPNMIGTEQKLGELTLNGDELSWSNPASPATGGRVVVIWKRAK